MIIIMLSRHHLPHHVHDHDRQLNRRSELFLLRKFLKIKFGHCSSFFPDSALPLSIITIGLSQRNVIGHQSVTIIIQGIKEMRGDEQGKNGEQKKTGVIGPEAEMVDGKLLRRLVDVIFCVTCRRYFGKTAKQTLLNKMK